MIHHHVLFCSSPSVSPCSLFCIVHFSFIYLTVHHPTCHLPSRNLAFIPALCSTTLVPNLSSQSLQYCFSCSTLTVPISLTLPHHPLFFPLTVLLTITSPCCSLLLLFLSLLTASLLPSSPLRPLKSDFISWENVTSILTTRLLSRAR